MLTSEDLEKNPGTLALAVAWVLVFGTMEVIQWRNPVAPVPIPDILPVSTIVSHRFGDMTWHEIRHGEIWRLLTATFVHFGVIHLVMNGVALISLGRLVEPWYRTGPFLAICVAIGSLGNLTGGAIRQWVGLARPWLEARTVALHLPNRIVKLFQGGPGLADGIHTGGGSTILLGLLTLAAVVGWRSRTRVGDHLQKQMLILLGLTAVLGIGMSQLVDNYGHLGGAIIGALIGLCDPPLLRVAESRSARTAAWVVALGLTSVCLAWAIRDDRNEIGLSRQVLESNQRLILDDGVRSDLAQLFGLYVKSVGRSPALLDPWNELDAMAVAELLRGEPALNLPRNLPPEQLAKDRADLEAVIDRLAKHPHDVWGPAVAADLASLIDLARSALDTPITYQNTYDFLVAWKEAFRVINQDLADRNAQRMELEKAFRQDR